MNDPLSDMLVRIKNAQSTNKPDVLVINSAINRSVCDVLIEEGFIANCELIKDDNSKSFLCVKLKYYDADPVIKNIKRISKPSSRVYAKCRDIPKSVAGFGVIVISTSHGVMSDRKARASNFGGELLFSIN